MQTTGGKVTTGGGKFTYSVEGHSYNWIERPFIGKWVGWYYITIVLIFIALYMFVGPMVFCLLYGVFWLFCPLLAPIPPILIIYGLCSVCGFTGGRGRRRRAGRSRNQRFGRQATRSGVLSFSPTGSKKGKQPDFLGGSFKKQASFGGSVKKQQSLKKQDSVSWFGGSPSPAKGGKATPSSSFKKASPSPSRGRR